MEETSRSSGRTDGEPFGCTPGELVSFDPEEKNLDHGELDLWSTGHLSEVKEAWSTGHFSELDDMEQGGNRRLRFSLVCRSDGSNGVTLLAEIHTFQTNLP